MDFIYNAIISTSNFMKCIISFHLCRIRLRKMLTKYFYFFLKPYQILSGKPM